MLDKVLTISIAAYNSEKYIKNCLDSILKCKNIDKLEIIVVDDGGSDSTFSIVKDYEDKYRGIIIPVHKDNGGWGSTVNYSIVHANSKYFKILDADDLFNTDEIDGLIDFLEKTECDLIITPYIEHNINNNKDLYINDMLLQMHSFTVKTGLLKENRIQITENCFYTDIEFVFLCIGVAHTYKRFNKYIYIYNIGYSNQSVNNTQFVKKVDEHELVCKKILNIYEKLSNADLCINRNIVYDRLIELVYKHFSILYMLPISRENLIRIKDFDTYLKQYKSVYDSIKLKRVMLLRFCDILYYPIALFLHTRSKIYSVWKER